MMETSRINTIAALIKMLDDPDNRVFPVIRNKLISFGTEALPSLETALENCFDEQLSERMISVAREIRLQIILQDLSEWKHNDPENLLKGFLLVSRIGKNDLDEVEIQSQLAQLKTDMWIELHEGLTALEKIKVINHVLYQVHRFEGSPDHFSDPEFSYIYSVLQRRAGSPLSLGLIYLVLCRQLGLPVAGVNLPQHFILAYLNRNFITEPKITDILFYINPFNKGGVFSRHEIDNYVSQLKIKPENSFYTPCSNLGLIRRLLNNLLFIFKSRNEEIRINQIETLLNAL